MTFGVARAASIGGVSTPTAPASVSLSDNGNVGQVVVDWTEGAGWVNIIDYTISWYDGGVLQGSVTTTNKPHTLSLTAGQKFTFRVSARSLAGQGLESADSQLWHVANAVAFLSTGTFTAPASKSYTFHVVGGGGGGSADGGSGGYGGGGSSGYYYNTIQSMTSGEQMVCNIGAGGVGSADGSASSINRPSQSTILSAAGGLRGLKTEGRPGGSGSGNGGYGDPVKAGGYGGSGGTDGQSTGGRPRAAGQLNLPYGSTSGKDDRIPSGGSGSYFIGPVSYGGIYGYGAGNSGGQNQNASGRGCGSGGTSWSKPARNGAAGMIIVFG